jgi:hypothetical protein
MATHVISHEVDYVELRLQSPIRKEVFGPMGITVRTFSDPQGSNRVGLIAEIPDMGEFQEFMQTDAVAEAMKHDGVRPETLLRENSHHLAYTTMLLPSMLLIGLGWALAFPALNVQATAGVAGREQGLAAGLFNIGFQIGGAVGVAVIGAVISSHTTAEGGQAQAALSSIRPRHSHPDPGRPGGPRRDRRRVQWEPRRRRPHDQGWT